MASTPEGRKPEPEPWNEDSRQKFQTKSRSEFYDPCQEAASRSYKCLYRNGGDKTMCGEYFQCVQYLPERENIERLQQETLLTTECRAYRDCKQAWTEKRRKEAKGFW
ncbi:hypothetical protein S7711_01645 [Stachybotrys chartarum IBT 7711]|uniref:CHCH domain-containing protein n=1 Tax=Stachybotrys chartarum (strain CBS 109288 / IBT 7711) TaxID=1280523 RepID=A0A084AV55_STACB|nr:hypothetical protein S7711_01645 [Stachybotrys chartarum IBT 7711]KFA53810.1 hypothetical protein S40293_01673 [Stachybotrys chartarum IBT 40293]